MSAACADEGTMPICRIGEVFVNVRHPLCGGRYPSRLCPVRCSAGLFAWCRGGVLILHPLSRPCWPWRLRRSRGKGEPGAMAGFANSIFSHTFPSA